LRFQDSGGIFINKIPSDSQVNAATIQLGRSPNAEETAVFRFEVFQKFPSSEGIYDIEGLLDVLNMFSPERYRSFSGQSIMDTLTDLALEMELDNVEIGASLDYNKTLIQPGWSNAEFIRYLKKNILGNNQEAGYSAFIKCTSYESVLVMKSFEEFAATKYKYILVDSTQSIYDRQNDEIYYPFNEFRILDSSRLTGSYDQDYSYFDYDSSQYTINSLTLNDYRKSLSEYFTLGDRDKKEGNVTLFNCGANNDFTGNFKGRASNKYHHSLTNMIAISVSTWGLVDIFPGDILIILFLGAIIEDQRFSYQYQGYWMVKRVEHICGFNFFTRLTLVRAGIDTDMKTTLVSARNFGGRKTN
jgi:hypothetical protein